jgi:stage II sporulation protein D
LFRRIFAFMLGLTVGVFFLGATPVVVQGAGATNYSIIRVRLASIGTPASIKIKVNGNYSIPENKNIYLERKSYEIRVQNGQLVLKDGDTVYTLGSRFTFKQHKGSDPNHLSIVTSSTCNYKGDMEVRLEGSGISLTNHVYLETYLYGVVPYEMSNSWPLEALKAQAVAARSYALRHIGSRSGFDVVDTQSDQVYRGFNSNYGNCIRAVDETAKKALKYGSSFASTFYSSSNGGYTESSASVWSGTSISYLPAKPDSYDPVHKWSITLYKTQIDMAGKDLTNPDSWWGSVSEKDNANYKALINNLKDQLKSEYGSNIKIVSIDNIEFLEETAGKRKNKACFSVSFYVKGTDGYVMDEEGNIKKIEKKVTISTSSMRSLVGTTKMKSIYVNDPVLEGDQYKISGQGFGHGVGMSQFGAQTMANQNQSYAQILAFYYPGTTIEAVNIAPPSLTDMPSRGGDRPEEPKPPQDDEEKPKPPADDEEPPKPTYGKVNVTTTLNVRQGPGLQYKRIGSLKPNVRVEILDQGAVWYKIKTGSLQGYVHGDYIKLESNEQPPKPPADDQDPKPPVDPPTPPSNERRYAIVTASALNVRSGPSTRNHRVGMVVRGNKLTILEKSGEWYKMEYKGLQGYVHGNYIKFEGGSTTQPTNPGSGNVIGKGTVVASLLNVRSGAGTNYRRIGALSRNAQVDVLEKVGSWYKIKYSNTTGYVHGDYLKLSSGGSGGSSSRGDENQGKTGIVTASGLNVRSGAGTNFKRIGFLNRNSQVSILGQTGSWYRIKYGNTTGYVHSDYIKVSAGSTSRGDDRPQQTSTATVTASWLNVRTGPGTNYRRIGAIQRNCKVTILKKSGSWYNIQYGSMTGYVSGEYLKLS